MKAINAIDNGASDDFGEYGNGGRNQTRNYFGAIDALTINGFGARYDIKVMAVF